MQNFLARAIRLYEQEPGSLSTPPGLECTCKGGLGGSFRGFTLTCLAPYFQLPPDHQGLYALASSGPLLASSGQGILIHPEYGTRVGGSDPRKDGCAMGF